MQWIAPSEKDADNAALEKRLWDGAGLKQSKYSARILGLAFLHLSAQRKKREGDAPSEPKLSRRGSRVDEPAAYHVKSSLNLPPQNVFSDHELEKSSVIQFFRITAADGKTDDTGHFNLSDMALRQIPMTMQDWETRLNRFIAATDREILQDAGKVTAEIATAHAESEFEKYRIVQDRLFESDFDRIIKELPPEEEKP